MVEPKTGEIYVCEDCGVEIEAPTSCVHSEEGACSCTWPLSYFGRLLAPKTQAPDCGPLPLVDAQAGVSGVASQPVSDHLGHATVSITLDTYSHAIPALQEEAAALIAGLVFGGE